MSERIIKTGLPKRFKDMLAAVIGQCPTAIGKTPR